MLGLLAWTALAAVTAAPLAAQQPRPRQGDLKVGDAAPDFSVKDVQGNESVQLSDLKGQPVVLIFGSCT
jgi:cytochrome oxidase Cu insertion factor (SCO1/SenC/PrrC family)